MALSLSLLLPVSVFVAFSLLGVLVKKNISTNITTIQKRDTLLKRLYSIWYPTYDIRYSLKSFVNRSNWSLDLPLLTFRISIITIITYCGH